MGVLYEKQMQANCCRDVGGPLPRTEHLEGKALRRQATCSSHSVKKAFAHLPAGPPGLGADSTPVCLERDLISSQANRGGL